LDSITPVCQAFDATNISTTEDRTKKRNNAYAGTAFPSFDPNIAKVTRIAVALNNRYFPALLSGKRVELIF
jgi:hypothetical protein